MKAENQPGTSPSPDSGASCTEGLLRSPQAELKAQVSSRRPLLVPRETVNVWHRQVARLSANAVHDFLQMVAFPKCTGFWLERCSLNSSSSMYQVACEHLELIIRQ